MTQYLMVISIRSIIGANKRVIDTLKSLKLRKNTLRVLPYNPVYKGMIVNDRCAWTIVDGEEVNRLFGKTEVHLALNNPKKGHICKVKHGYKEYKLFKKQFIDRMYLRL